MKLAVQVGTVADGSLKGAIQYAKDLEVDRLVVPWNVVPSFAEKGYLTSDGLRGVQKEVEDAGMGFSVMVAGPVRRPGAERGLSAMTLDSPDGRAQFSDLCRNLECMGKAGVDVLMMHVSLERPSD